MTKAELVSKVAEKAGVTKKVASACVDAFVKVLAESLEKGERTAVPGLGVFKVKERKARKGRNPRTGEVIEIPARKVAVFVPSKHLRNL